MSTEIIEYDGNHNPKQVASVVCMGQHTWPGGMRDFIIRFNCRMGDNSYIVGFRVPNKYITQATTFVRAVSGVLSDTSAPLKCQLRSLSGSPIVSFDGDDEDEEVHRGEASEDLALELVGDINAEQVLLFSYLARWWTEKQHAELIKDSTSEEAVLAAMFHVPPEGWSGGAVFPLQGHHVASAYFRQVMKPPKDAVNTIDYWAASPKRALVEWPKEALRRMFDPGYEQWHNHICKKDQLTLEDIYNRNFDGCGLWAHREQKRKTGGEVMHDEMYTMSLRLGGELSHTVSREAWAKVLSGRANELEE